MIGSELSKRNKKRYWRVKDRQEESLEDHLDLRDFINLEVLYCQNNKLTSLDLSQNQKLEMVDAHGNWISANLDTFSHLTNLGTLILSSTTTAALKQEEFLDARLGLARGARDREVGKWVSLLDEDESGCYCNDFSGSLEALKNCQNLVSLSVKNQENIAGELKDLPASLEVFNCEGTVFQQELEPFENNFKFYRLTQEVRDLNLENKQLRKENQELKEKLKLAQGKLEENQQLEAKIEILPVEKNSKLK